MQAWWHFPGPTAFQVEVFCDLFQLCDVGQVLVAVTVGPSRSKTKLEVTLMINFLAQSSALIKCLLRIVGLYVPVYVSMR